MRCYICFWWSIFVYMVYRFKCKPLARTDRAKPWPPLATTKHPWRTWPGLKQREGENMGKQWLALKNSRFTMPVFKTGVDRQGFETIAIVGCARWSYIKLWPINERCQGAHAVPKLGWYVPCTHWATAWRTRNLNQLGKPAGNSHGGPPLATFRAS